MYSEKLSRSEFLKKALGMSGAMTAALFVSGCAGGGGEGEDGGENEGGGGEEEGD